HEHVPWIRDLCGQDGGEGEEQRGRGRRDRGPRPEEHGRGGRQGERGAGDVLADVALRELRARRAREAEGARRRARVSGGAVVVPDGRRHAGAFGRGPQEREGGGQREGDDGAGAGGQSTPRRQAVAQQGRGQRGEGDHARVLD